MPAGRPNRAKQLLTDAASKLIRERGYADTSLDDICAAAGVTRGALFHNFTGKEALTHACLADWRADMKALLDSYSEAVADPIERLDFVVRRFAERLASPGAVRSCLAGTVLQEVAGTHEALRRSAGECLEGAKGCFERLIQEAAGPNGEFVDAGGIAEWLVVTIQGSLLLFKGTRDPQSILGPMDRVRRQIVSEVRAARALR